MHAIPLRKDSHVPLRLIAVRKCHKCLGGQTTASWSTAPAASIRDGGAGSYESALAYTLICLQVALCSSSL